MINYIFDHRPKKTQLINFEEAEATLNNCDRLITINEESEFFIFFFDKGTLKASGKINKEEKSTITVYTNGSSTHTTTFAGPQAYDLLHLGNLIAKYNALPM